MPNHTEVLSSVAVTLSTKDSIQVVWSVFDELVFIVRGFKVRYQAVGSNVVQYSRMLSASTSSHDITRLHENTAYDICIHAFIDTGQHHHGQIFGEITGADLSAAAAEASTGVSMSSGCVTGSTAIDAFRVAIGSTLGAFIALGVVVGFVLLAKCQAHHGHHVNGYGTRGRRRLASTESDEVSLNEDDIIDFDDDYEGQLQHIVFAPPPGSSLILPVGEKMPGVGRKAFLVSPVGDQITSPSDCRSIALSTGEEYPFSSTTASDGTTYLKLMTSPTMATDDVMNPAEIPHSVSQFIKTAQNSVFHSPLSSPHIGLHYSRSEKQSDVHAAFSDDEAKKIQVGNNVEMLDAASKDVCSSISQASGTPIQPAFKLILVSDSGETVLNVVDRRKGINSYVDEYEDGYKETNDVISAPVVSSSTAAPTSISTSGLCTSEDTGQIKWTIASAANALASQVTDKTQGDARRTGCSQHQLNGDSWCLRLMEQFSPSSSMSNLGHSILDMSASHDAPGDSRDHIYLAAAETANTNSSTDATGVMVGDDVNTRQSPVSFRSRPRPAGRLADTSGRLSPDPTIFVGRPRQQQLQQSQLQPHHSCGGLRQNSSSVW